MEQPLEKAEDQQKYVARIRTALGRGWKGVKPQKGSSQYEIEKAANSLRCGKLILRFAFGRYWNKKQVMICAEAFDREVEKIGVSKIRPPESAVKDIRRRLLPQAMARQVEIEKEVRQALEYRREKDLRFRKLAAAGAFRRIGIFIHAVGWASPPGLHRRFVQRRRKRKLVGGPQGAQRSV